MIDALDIGYAIKDRRAQLGLTQAQVAEVAGVSKRCLWALELGQNPGVQFNKLAAVLEALDLDLCITTTDSSPKRDHEFNYQAVSLNDKDHEGPAQPQSPKANNKIDALAILTGAQQ